MKIFLYVLVMLLIPSITFIINEYLFGFKKYKAHLIMEPINEFLIINSMNLVCVYNLWGYSNIFIPNKQEYIFFLYLFLNGLLIGLIYLAIKMVAKHFLDIEKRKKASGGAIAIFIVSILFIFIGILGFTATNWEREVYYNSSPDQILITLLTPIVGTDPKLYFSFIQGPLLLTSALTYIISLIYFIFLTNSIRLKKNIKEILKEISTRNICIILSSLLIVSGLTYTFIGLQVDKIVAAYTIESDFILDNYVDPGEAKIIAPTKKRNLIHIYLESIENSFLDTKSGGAMNENLIPNLETLYLEGDNFSHADGYGGPLRVYGGSFSCGSMVNQFFGLPMKVPTVYKEYGAPGKFLPGAVGLGDILYAAGYEISFLHGADSNFGGLQNMFYDHGRANILDYKYYLANGSLPEGYRVNWGFEDEKLYEFSKQELLRLAGNDKPFYVVVENADTHNPGFAFDGDTPIFGETDKKEDYAKTIKFSDKHVVEFVHWIQKQDFYKDTTIVIIGDHNSMDGSLFKDSKDKSYIRTTYNVVLNPAPSVDRSNKEIFHNRKWANFDMLPTLLTAMGFEIEGDRLGLGTNLYSGKPTAFERLGYNEVNDMLVCKSSLYNKKFVKGKISYNGENIINI